MVSTTCLKRANQGHDDINELNGSVLLDSAFFVSGMSIVRQEMVVIDHRERRIAGYGTHLSFDILCMCFLLVSCTVLR